VDAYEPFVSIGIALAAGLLIGLEREQSQRPEGAHTHFIGGVRTFPLFALLGAVSMLLSGALTLWLPVAAFLGVLTLLAISFADDVKKERDRGLTTEAAVLVTFLLGALATSEDVVEPTERRVIVVAALAVIVTFLLSAKPRLHSLVSRVSRDDLYATVKFLIVAVLVLPLLPNRTVGPLDAVNPFDIGLMVVVIAGVSFVGYVASRTLGTGRGLAVTALLGGLVSSTAVTLSFSGRAKKDSALASIAAVAIVLASAIMFGRILVIVAVIHAPLLRPLSVPILAMMVAGLAAGTILYRRTSVGAEAAAAVPLSNPFELSLAVRFGLLFALVLLASKAAQVYAGTGGMYVAALLAGSTDVDAITLSAASLARDGLDPRVATTTILLGAVSNTLVKGGMAAVLGGWKLGRIVLTAFGAVLATAALAAGGVWLFS
jgi:uncharacterized membrane protein (DUF4010 family)